jgi:hypothetical protein
MKNVSGPQVVTPAGTLESPLPAQIQDALGDLGRRGEGGAVGAERRCRAVRRAPS